MSADLTSDQSLAIVNKLVRQFDAAADNLGVERVRTLRNGYLANCGMTVPRLDNVRRTVDFAIEMQRIIDRFNSSSGNQLRLRAGIDTGTVSSGLVGRSTLAYDTYTWLPIAWTLNGPQPLGRVESWKPPLTDVRWNLPLNTSIRLLWKSAA